MITLAERRRVERFASLVENPGDNASGELAALQTLARTLQRVPINGDIDPVFRTKLRTRMVAMSTVRLPTQRGTAEPAARATGAPRRQGRLSRRMVVLGGVSACVLSLSALGAASMNSVAGDPLYGLKRAAESAQVSFAGSDTDRGERYLAQARTRLAEARQVRGDQRALLETLTAMDLATHKGSRLLTGVAASEQDRGPLDTLDKFVTAQRTALGALVPTLPAGKSRDRAVKSLALVERLGARSTALRATVVCPAAAAPADDLGPRPVSCAVGGDVPGTGTSGTGLGGTGQPGALAGVPGAGVASPTEPAPADGVAGAVTGIVKDVLGGLGGDNDTTPTPTPAPAPVAPPLPLPLPLPSPLQPPSILPALPLLTGTG